MGLFRLRPTLSHAKDDVPQPAVWEAEEQHRWQTNLYEIPALMEAALDLFTIKELREAAFHVIHQAAGIG